MNNLKYKSLIDAKLIKGDFDAFDAFMEHKEPQGALEWIAENKRKNGPPKNALIEFIKFVHPDKTERKDIINIAEKYFNKHLVSSNFPPDNTNTGHWEKIKDIMT